MWLTAGLLLPTGSSPAAGLDLNRAVKEEICSPSQPHPPSLGAAVVSDTFLLQAPPLPLSSHPETPLFLEAALSSLGHQCNSLRQAVEGHASSCQRRAGS